MSHCPNCETNGGKCSHENPCCDCVVRAMNREEEAFKKLEELLGIWRTEEIHQLIRKFLNQ